MTLTVLDVERWNAGDVRAVFHAATSRAQAAMDAAAGLAKLPAFETWGGEAAEAAREAIGQTRKDLDAHGNEVLAVANAARAAADEIDRIKSELARLKADAEALGMEIDPVAGTVLPGPKVRNPMEAELKRAQLQPRLSTIVAEANVVDTALANVINMAIGKTQIPPRGLHPEIPDQPPQDPTPVTEDERKRNQKEAFRKIFGRDPASKSDWTTAAGLDPHSYESKFRGVPPEVRVVRIRPVPGQGVVRSSQFISDRDVTSWPPPSRDLGNNRGPDANFDPEDTKVTTIIDYDNGIVVVRQNPTVVQNADGSTGEVRIGQPTGTATQTVDGAIRIKYDAANPFAPQVARDPSGVMADHVVTVNGDLVFTPGANGVQIGGTRTDYPWMEVYQDMPDGTSHTVLIDPAANGGSLGPSTNLPFHHDVGSGGSAFVPFDTGGWNPHYDVPIPLPGTSFGPADVPPSVPPLPNNGSTQF